MSQKKRLGRYNGKEDLMPEWMVVGLQALACIGALTVLMAIGFGSAIALGKSSGMSDEEIREALARPVEEMPHWP
jgi:hypothetical protein